MAFCWRRFKHSNFEAIPTVGPQNVGASSGVLVFRTLGDELCTHSTSLYVREAREMLERNHYIISGDSVEFLMGGSSVCLEDEKLLVPPGDVYVVVLDNRIGE